MHKKMLFSVLLFALAYPIKAQVVIIPFGLINEVIIPEHGFLPGKKFQFYPLIGKYDFSKLKLRVEVFDDRNLMKLTKVQCSNIDFTNESEFVSPSSIYKVSEYVEKLFKETGATIDSSSTDIIQIRLEGIDARLIGFGNIRAHGLCQMKVMYHNIAKVYCVDITDEHKNSPISSNSFVTRKTATRVFASAAIREVIEQFFVDLKSVNASQ